MINTGKAAGVGLSIATTEACIFFRNLQDGFRMLHGMRHVTPLCIAGWCDGMRAPRACQLLTTELMEHARPDRPVRHLLHKAKDPPVRVPEVVD